MFPKECIILDPSKAWVLPAYSNNQNHIGHQLSYQLGVVLSVNAWIQRRTLDPSEYISNISVFSFLLLSWWVTGHGSGSSSSISTNSPFTILFAIHWGMGADLHKHTSHHPCATQHVRKFTWAAHLLSKFYCNHWVTQDSHPHASAIQWCSPALQWLRDPCDLRGESSMSHR